MFDNDLILLDGSVITTTSLDTPPTSTTVDSDTGARVIDLLETGVTGLVAVMFCSELADAADDYYLEAYLQASDTEDMTSATDIEKLGAFGVANATTGRIIGSETPCVATVRFATKKRYVRLHFTVTTGSFGYIKVYLTPWPFKVL